MATVRSTPMLYRDCLRLIRHVAGESPKGMQLRTIVAAEFRKYAGVTDPQEIEMHKYNAVRALSNYLMAEEAVKSPRPAVGDDIEWSPSEKAQEVSKWERDMNKSHFKFGSNNFVKKAPKHHGLPGWKKKGSTI